VLRASCCPDCLGGTDSDRTPFFVHV